MDITLPPTTKASQFRDGVGISEDDLNKWVISGEAKKNMLCSRAKGSNPIQYGQEYYIMSDVDRAYDEATETISKALDAYNTTITRFRSTIKNDLTSIASSAQKTVKESEKIGSAYAKAISQLTSQEMDKAIENAERLAAALKTISDAKSAEIYFKLVDMNDPKL